MTRFYFRLTLLPFVLLTAVLLVIRSQPYDDHELRELLLPTGCPAPCFMGIRPGVTTVEEAVAILEASGWIDRLTVTELEPRSGRTARISWIWSESAPYLFKLPPPYFDYARQGVIDLDENNVVDSVLIETDIEFGSIWLLWDHNIYYRIETGNGPNEVIPFQWDYWAGYGILSLEYWIQARSSYDCPVRRIMWEHKMNLEYDDNPLGKYDDFYKDNNFLTQIRRC